MISGLPDAPQPCKKCENKNRRLYTEQTAYCSHHHHHHPGSLTYFPPWPHVSISVCTEDSVHTQTKKVRSKHPRHLRHPDILCWYQRSGLCTFIVSLFSWDRWYIQPGTGRLQLNKTKPPFLLREKKNIGTVHLKKSIIYSSVQSSMC